VFGGKGKTRRICPEQTSESVKRAGKKRESKAPIAIPLSQEKRNGRKGKEGGGRALVDEIQERGGGVACGIGVALTCGKGTPFGRLWQGKKQSSLSVSRGLLRVGEVHSRLGKCIRKKRSPPIYRYRSFSLGLSHQKTHTQKK